MINVIIVEDDPKHSSALTKLLGDYEMRILDTCTNVSDAYNSIVKHKPDLVFLDIDLDKGDNGFDLLKMFPDLEFAVIFTTQFSTASNAINAFRACALDFLPKPVDTAELKNAIHTFNKKIGIEQVKTLVKNLSGEGPKEIWISNTDGKIKIEIDKIIHCKSENVYTFFYLSVAVFDKKTHISSKSIKNWEKELQDSCIIRIHNRYMVNLQYVRKYTSQITGGAFVILQDGTKWPVSKSRKKQVKLALELKKKFF